MASPTNLREHDAKLGLVVSIHVAVAAWLVPGLVHLLLRRWGRALVFFLAVGGLALAGHLMRGELYTPQSRDSFGTLGFLADFAAGIFYFLPRVLGSAGPDLSGAAGSYGTRMIATAGIVILLGVLDAFGIAHGRRS